MAEQAAFLGLAERRARASSSTRAADVVQERRGEQQVGAQPRMELRRARGRSSRRRPCARAGRRRSRGARRASPGSARSAPRICASPTKRRDGRPQPGVRDLAGEELEEAVELVRVAAHRRARAPAGSTSWPARSSAPRAAAGRGSARPGRARAPRRPRRTGRRAGRRRSRRAPRSGRSGRRARARGTARRRACAAAPSSRPRRRPRRRGPARARRSQTRAESRPETDATVSPRGRDQAVSRASLRRPTAPARSTTLVAPPYDVIGPAERERYLAREPVQRRPPDAARLRGGGRPAACAPGARTASSRDEEPAFWALSQDYVGPGRRRAHADGPRRRRSGRAVRERHRPAARADAPRARRRGGCGSCARRRRSSSRSSSSTRARPRSRFPTGRRSSRSRARASGACDDGRIGEASPTGGS